MLIIEIRLLKISRVFKLELIKRILKISDSDVSGGSSRCTVCPGELVSMNSEASGI
jgi:hypothetical protein